MRVRVRRPFATAVAGGSVAASLLAAAPAGTAQEPAGARPAEEVVAALDPAPRGDVTVAPRLAVPEDRYAMAGGCYTLRSEAAEAYLTRTDGGFAVSGPVTAAEPLHFQAYDLGKYLLFGTAADFVAAQPGPVEQLGDAVDPALRRAPVGPDTDLPRALHGDLPRSGTDGQRAVPATPGDGVVAAGSPSELAEWVVRETPAGGVFTFHLPVPDGVQDDPGPLGPETAGTLAVADDGRLVIVDGHDTGPATRFALDRTQGCAPWPEVEVNVEGDVVGGPTPYGEVRGYLDGHLHMMAFEFLGGRARCGQPWHPYGVTHALVDCPDHEPGGHGAVLEAALSGGDPVAGHDTVGWPTFGYWPRHDSLTHEQVYYRWLERAWRGGLRAFVNLLVDNNVLCELYPQKRNSCNEMDGVHLQAGRLRQLERYVDAQWGGPGEGWLRIVTDPFEARRTMNEGRLAVIIGIEVSALFDCVEYLGTPRCATDDIDRQLAEVHELGVRQMELVNKFDNALSGVAGDSGGTGVLVNSGNRIETGHFWPMRTCDDGHGHGHDKTQYNVTDESGGATAPLTGHDALAGGILLLAGTSGVAPVYPQGPHCNTIGLTDLGVHLLDRMVERGMVFDPDHMSALGRRQALDHLEAAGYSGVISSHSWADDPSYQRIWRMGGVVTPMSKGSEGFLQKWRNQRAWADDRYLFGLGYGADTNGFAAQGPPRNPPPGEGVTYPFEGFGGVTVHRQVSGEKVYDVNTDGVDHYGLYPDWIEDVAVLAGEEREQLLADLARGPEAYLQMWERALGVAPDACRTDVADLSDATFAEVARGMTPEEVLLVAGQPTAREATTFTYCTERGTGTVTFDDDGRAHHTTNAPGSPPSRGSGGSGAASAAPSTVVADGPAGSPQARDHGHGADGVDHRPVHGTRPGGQLAGVERAPAEAALPLAAALAGLVAAGAGRLARRPGGRATSGSAPRAPERH